MRRRPQHMPKALDFFEDDDRRGTWTIREHPERSSKGQFKRQWRWVRRAPVIVQIIIGLFALTWFMVCFFASWLVIGGLTMPR
jgi:hypothetical protein